MTTVKNQFIVRLEGCESKKPSLVTLPRGNTLKEGESLQQQEHFNINKVSTSSSQNTIWYL